jgi:hypothetical protein
MASPQKKTWMILTYAFMMSIGLYCGLVLMLNAQPLSTPPDASVLPVAHTICYTFAAVGLLGSLYWSQVKMRATTAPPRFQTDMVLALALAELPTISGLLLFFLSRKTTEFWPFAIASLLIMALFILPRVLQRD